MSTLTKTNLNIEEIVQAIESAPVNQKAHRGFQGVAQQMQQSGNPDVQSWGSQLQQGTPQLAKACQQS